MKIVCPSCNCTTSFNPLQYETRAVIANQRPEQVNFLQVIAELVEPHVPNMRTYGIIRCQACHKKIVVKREPNSREDDWEVVYPINHRKAPIEIPEPIKSEMEEAYLCEAIGVYKACVCMCQTALESMWRDKNAKSLNDLVEKHIILPPVKDRAEEIRLWANVIKHEPIRDAISKEDADQLLDYFDLILNAVYVEPSKLEALKTKRKGLSSNGH